MKNSCFWWLSATSQRMLYRCRRKQTPTAGSCCLINGIERGTRNLSLINIDGLAQALDLSLSQLFQRVERS